MDQIHDPYSNTVLPMESLKEKEVIVSKAQRDKNYSNAEDILIVSAWLNTSKNSVRLNGVKGGGFWDRIMKYIEENGGTTRTLKSIRNRWGEINAYVGKFVGLHRQIEDKAESEKNEQKRLEDTYTLHLERLKRPSKFEHCWLILRDNKKWNDQLPNKKPQKNSEASPATPDTINLENECEHSSARPQGRKAAKLVQKKGKEGIEETASSLVSKEFLQKRTGEHNIAMEAHREQWEIEQRNLRCREREIEAQQEHEDSEIMKVDTRQMDEISVIYFKKKKLDIMKRKNYM